MTTKITNKTLSIVMLVGAIVGCFGGVLLLGEILFQAARMLLGLSSEPWTTLILPGVLLILLMLIGTAILIAAIFVENTKMKVAIIAFSVAIPVVGEVIDLSIRAILLFNELNIHYNLV